MNSFGHLFRVTTWGESHGPALGVIIDGCPPNIEISLDDFEKDLARRRPGPWKTGSTSRIEPDEVEILSGIFEGKTLGTPISLMIRNKKAKPEDYEALKNTHRKGHADHTYEAKYGHRDYRGGGRASGRETAARVLAGTIAKKILPLKYCAGFLRLGNVVLPQASTELTPEMIQEIESAQNEGDSVGGIMEVSVTGLPQGLGWPVFGKLEAELAKALMSIGTIKGFEFGEGFRAAAQRGSQHNQKPSGGIAGGISDGTPLTFRVALKPPSSIAQSVKGRHDACILPRLGVILESMVACVLADHFLMQKTNES